MAPLLVPLLSLPSFRHVKCLPLQQLQCEASEVAETKATSLRLHSLAMSLAGDEFHLESEEDLLANRRVPFRSSLHIQFLGPTPDDVVGGQKGLHPFVASVCADQISYHPPFYVRGFSSSGIVFWLWGSLRQTEQARWPRRQPPIDLRRKQSIPPGRNVVDRLTLISRARTERTDPASRRKTTHSPVRVGSNVTVLGSAAADAFRDAFSPPFPRIFSSRRRFSRSCSILNGKKVNGSHFRRS